VLGKCNQGIDLNLISFRRLTHVYRSNSCPAGLGGYSHEGFVWRFYLPDNLQFRASNNLLEHLAAIITPWIDIIAGQLTKGDCTLSMTDSTTSEGWLRKSNFIKDGEDPIQATIRIEVACLHATHYLSNEIREYSQWFRGANNNVADALSRDNDRTEDELNQTLRSHCSSQLPKNFEIVPLPNEIVSWLTSLLLRLPAKQQLVETHSTTKLRLGTTTQSTANPSDSETTFSSKTCPEPTAYRIEIIGGYAMAVRQGRFSRPRDAPLAESTVSDTLNHVVAVFRENGHDDPKRDAERNVARLVRHQLRSYKKDDPKEVQQKTLPVCILRLILSSKSTELCQAMGELAGAAHFWAMRSCKYAKVPKAEQRQTKQLCIRNIAFIRDGETLAHNSQSLHLADCVSVTFERQKNDRKADTVT